MTGRVPFTGESHVSIALKHIEEEAKPPKEINGDIPEELNNIILKAIAKKPENRYNSVAEMLRDLKEVNIKVDSIPEVSNQHTLIIPREEYKKEIAKEKEDRAGRESVKVEKEKAKSKEKKGKFKDKGKLEEEDGKFPKALVEGEHKKSNP